MATRQEILCWGEAMLQKSGIADWKMDSWLLYEEVTSISRTHFLLQKLEEMPVQEIDNYKKMIEKRCTHIPLQYITGRQEFAGLEFLVNEDVLIPRLDTEVLVFEIEKYLEGRERVLDMCTGSGCIAISLKKRNEQLDVTAVDYSKKALEVAEKNCQSLQADICLVQSDLFEMFEQTQQFHQFDVIVSNPPYIPTKVIETLEEEVRCHEPLLALDGTEDGLEFYRRITRESRQFLTGNGMLFYEIGHDQAEAVSSIMEAEGFYDIHVIKDLSGLDRVVYGGMKNV